MGIPSSEIVNAIYQLLPGFVAAWIFYGLTAHRRTAPFERVIQALIFTLFAEAIVQVLGMVFVGIGDHYPNLVLGPWTSTWLFVWKVVFSIAIGFLFAWLANTNRFHALIPDSISKRTSYPSEWFSAFNRTKRNVYLHLHDGRRLFGWPEEWPDSPSSGHFVLMNVAWILPDNQHVELAVTERFLLPATDVRFVEFEKSWDLVLEQSETVECATERVLHFNASVDSKGGSQHDSAKAKESNNAQ